jgi:hypothetical protein
MGYFPSFIYTQEKPCQTENCAGMFFRLLPFTLAHLLPEQMEFFLLLHNAGASADLTGKCLLLRPA